MKNRHTIQVNDSQQLWQQVYNDLSTEGTNDYRVAIQHENYVVDLDLVSSPGGNIEGGYEYTKMIAPLHDTRFLFSITPEDFLMKIGKFFGSQDVVVGYPDFDENVIVKTNNEQQFKSIFSDEQIRELFQSLSGYSFGVVEHSEKEGPHLELLIQRAITNLPELQKIYSVFTRVLDRLVK